MTNKISSRTVPDGVQSTRSILDARRRERVLTEDRRERRSHFGWGLVNTTPLALTALDLNALPRGVDIVMAMVVAWAALGPPVLIIGSLIPTKERRRLRRNKTYVPMAPKLEDGTTGPEWSEDRKDVLFGRVDRLMDAVQRRAPVEDVDAAISSFAKRVTELLEGRSIHRPDCNSPHHYWPNSYSRPGTHDGDTIVSYDDNLPIDAQRNKFRIIRDQAEKALSNVRFGIEIEQVLIALLDLVAVTRRIVELSGYAPGLLRHEEKSLGSDRKEGVALPRRMPESAAAALKLVRQAVELDPDCTDGLGNRIQPLDGHVARLLKAHAVASEMADADQRAELDAQMDQAMGYVSAAAQQGIDLHQRTRLQRFGTEMLFIASRHTENPLSSLPEDTRPA